MSNVAQENEMNFAVQKLNSAVKAVKNKKNTSTSQQIFLAYDNIYKLIQKQKTQTLT